MQTILARSILQVPAKTLFKKAFVQFSATIYLAHTMSHGITFLIFDATIRILQLEKLKYIYCLCNILSVSQ